MKEEEGCRIGRTEEDDMKEGNVREKGERREGDDRVTEK